MIDQGPLTLFYCPQTRSEGTLKLLEELGAKYELKVLNLKNKEHKSPEFLAINPMGKVPTIKHKNAVVTEQVAIYTYLADVFADAGLAPALNDPMRGPYLRWMAFYGSSFEPAAVDKAMKREPGMAAMSPYGDYDTVIKALSDQLSKGPYFLGEKFTALDVLWGSALGWMIQFGLVPKTPVFTAYVERVKNRPASQRAEAIAEKVLKERVGQ